MSNGKLEDAVYKGDISKATPAEVSEIARKYRIPKEAVYHFHAASKFIGIDEGNDSVLGKQVKTLIRVAIRSYHVDQWKSVSEWDAARKIFLFDQTHRNRDVPSQTISRAIYEKENNDKDQGKTTSRNWEQHILLTFTDMELCLEILEIDKHLPPTGNRNALGVDHHWNICWGLLEVALQVLEVKDVFGAEESIGSTRIEKIWGDFRNALDDIRDDVCHLKGYDQMEAIESGDIRQKWINATLS